MDCKFYNWLNEHKQIVKDGKPNHLNTISDVVPVSNILEIFVQILNFVTFNQNFFSCELGKKWYNLNF